MTLAARLHSEPSEPSATTPGRDGIERPQPESRLTPELTAGGPPPASAVAVDLHIGHDLPAIEAEWKAFERHADCTVFQSFDWLARWQRHIGSLRGVAPAIVLGRDQGGELLFILQLAIEPGGGVRRLVWLGYQLCDYNAPLLAKTFSERIPAGAFTAIWQRAMAQLRSDPRFRFDLIDLQKMPETVGAQRNPLLELNVMPHPSGAYVATLDRDWEGFYAAKRSSSTRKRERRQLKQLTEHGDVRLAAAQDDKEAAAALETLISQKSRAFAKMGVENLFDRPGYRAFYRDIATDATVRGLTHVSRLDVGTTVVAASLGLTFRDSYYLVLSSYDDGELSRFGPGRAHLHELLRHAITHGFRRFDFTVGDEPYKRDWSDIELQLHDYLAAVTMRGRVAVAMATGFRRTKRAIKQSPTMWHAFSKIRGWKGSIGR
jgi:CelD/BcsL family acetyltransferase involved in cellulose biosynthesis